MSDRKSNFKNKDSLSPEHVRNRRHKFSVEIRKQKRQEILSKRRNLTVANTLELNETELQDLLDRLRLEIQVDNVDRQITATKAYRKLLSKEDNPPIQQVIDSKVVPTFVKFLMSGNPKLQFEAAWVLTNISYGTKEHTEHVISCGAVPILIDLLTFSTLEVMEQCVWALGNIAGDSTATRDYLLDQDAMTPILSIINEHQKPSVQRNTTWTLSNLCRGKPHAPWGLVRPALSTLAKLIHSTDSGIVIDACWTISLLSDGDDDHVQAVIETGMCTRLIELMKSPSIDFQIPAIRIVANLLTGTDVQTQVVLDSDVLSVFPALLKHPHKLINKESCWALSNILAGNTDQITAVIQAGLIPPLVNILSVAEMEVREEACWAIVNGVMGGNAHQIETLVEIGVIKPLCDMLTVAENDMINAVLDGIEKILKVGKQLRKDHVNRYALLTEECGGLDSIDALQTHENADIYKKAYMLIDQYFDDDDDTTQMVFGFDNHTIEPDFQF